MSQREGVGKVRVDRTRDVSGDSDGCWVNEEGGSNFTKNKGRSRGWSALLNRPCGLLLLLLVMFVFTSPSSSVGSSLTSTPSSPTSSLRVLVALSLFLLLGLLLLLLE